MVRDLGPRCGGLVCDDGVVRRGRRRLDLHPGRSRLGRSLGGGHDRGLGGRHLREAILVGGAIFASRESHQQWDDE